MKLNPHCLSRVLQSAYRTHRHPAARRRLRAKRARVAHVAGGEDGESEAGEYEGGAHVACRARGRGVEGAASAAGEGTDCGDVDERGRVVRYRVERQSRAEEGAGEEERKCREGMHVFLGACGVGERLSLGSEGVKDAVSL